MKILPTSKPSVLDPQCLFSSSNSYDVSIFLKFPNEENQQRNIPGLLSPTGNANLLLTKLNQKDNVA